MTDAPMPSHQQLALTRARQLFRFLKAFAERRVPVRRRLDEHEWRLALRELPEHPAIQVGSVRIAAAGEAEEGADAGAAAPLLRVGRPQLTPGPLPPDDLRSWMESHAPDDPDARPVVRQARERVNENGETIAEALGDDTERAAAAAHWLAAWDAWAERERPARAAKRVFDRFYALLGRIERESEQVELVLGDGRLRRRLADGVVDHPVLLQRVELEFDPEVPEFRVLDTDRAPELYGTVLQEEDGIAGAKLNELQRELEQVGIHPLEPERTTGFLKRLAALLGPDVGFHARAGAAAEPPSITRDAVLFLRQRASGFPAAFDRVLADLESEPELPPSLVRVVGVEPPSAAEGDDPPVTPWGEPLDVLLSKPANLEQVQIARTLERHGAVLVQGPPGTGKSHTIANLIGHLVAQGKRVLVTSHTTKALRVLRGHVVPELRPLCVSLLEQDLEGRQQLEQAVRGIVERLSTAQEPRLLRDIERLEAARERLIGELDRIAADLRMVREAEYMPIVVAGESVSPADAAREMVRAGGAHAWLPGPLTPGAPLPLPAADVRALHATNAELSGAEERELDADVPTLDQLPAPAELERTVAALSAEEPAELARFWRDAPVEECLPALDALGRTLQSFAAELAAMTPWQRALVEAGRDGGAERALWLTLREKVLEAKRRHDAARELLMENAVTLSDAPAWDALREAVPEMAEHVRGGGSLSALALLLRPRWKRVLAECTVNGRPPAAAVHFEAVRAHLALRREADALAQRWNRQGAAIGLPAFEPARGQAVATLAQYVEQFETLLAWWDARWAGVEMRLHEAGFAWDGFREREVARSAPASAFAIDVAIVTGPLGDAVERRRLVAYRDHAERELDELEERLARFRPSVCATLRDAVARRDLEGYTAAYRTLEALRRLHDVWLRRRALLARLAETAPAWADAVRLRSGVHGAAAPPGDPEPAWRWRQLHQELERRAALDERELAQRLERRRGELRDATTALVDRKAWLAQLRRTGLEHRAALIGWMDTQRRIGKGTGKRVPQLRVEARALLAQARGAVPVWIMPLARVAESFDPRTEKFDVVIVDEASQSDVTGLLAFYAGRQIVVVGDHEQVSPMAVGAKVDESQALIAQHLAGIPNAHLYDGQTSIYDLARAAFGGTIALREHFRCVPHIIDFSNYLSYDGAIRPMRDPATAARPHVSEVVVNGSLPAGRDGDVNVGEARLVAALVRAMTELPEYDGASIGAITLLADRQASFIQNEVLSLVDAVELQRRRFAAGNAAQFQGDERDVVLLSMVDSPRGGALPFRDVASMKQRYNVAASRARDQLWLVHSLDPGRDLQPGDLRRRLIEHVRDPGARRRAVEGAAARGESPFEREVIQHLVAAGYRVTPQVEVGHYRIDIVVSDDRGQIALECDGDRFHPTERIPDDLARQAVLERAGWRFVRLRGTRYFRDPDGAMQWVREELARLGIAPVGSGVPAPAAGGDGAALRERVLRRAWEIMEERGWVGMETAETAAPAVLEGS